MPNQLESYAVTLVVSILSGRYLSADATPEQTADAHQRQAVMLTELVEFLLEHEQAAGYSGATLGAVVVNAARMWIAQHAPTD